MPGNKNKRLRKKKLYAPSQEELNAAMAAFKEHWAKLAKQMRLMRERKADGLVLRKIRRKAFHVRAYDVRSHDAWVWVRPA